ncbi:MAG: IS21 family transposase [Firmicutes bacterium]|nr:IS21 family transposase [Bacillota bacterium]
MRKIREMLRLRFAAHQGVRAIARSCGLSHSTVSEALRRAEAAGLSWPLPEGMDDTALEQALYGARPVPKGRGAPLDMDEIYRQLRSRKGVTLRLLWLEYRQAHPDGYRYSRFCELYRRWAKTLDMPMRQVYRGGEKMLVDFAGDPIPVIDPETRQIRPAYLFVAVLGASNYTYAEPMWAQDQASWIAGHVHAFKVFGGVPEAVVCDNPKTAVLSACRYEPDLNPAYQEMAAHYGVVVLPARPRRPRDKAKAENAVQQVERWVVAPLRHRTFFGLEALSQAIQEQLEGLNNRPFQKLEGSRRELYERLDKPALRPLPAQRYEYAEWHKAKVNIDYHVAVDDNFYSTPYQLVHEPVDVRLSLSTVEIFHKGHRVASHPRLAGRGHFHTDPAHMPAAHRRHLEWTPSRLIQWGETVGPHTGRLVQAILESRPHPEQGYRACLGLFRLAKLYGPPRLEAAAQRALATQASGYRSVQSILRTGLDQMPLEPETPVAPLRHANVRGSAYYREGAV